MYILILIFNDHFKCAFLMYIPFIIKDANAHGQPQDALIVLKETREWGRHLKGWSAIGTVLMTANIHVMT